MLHPCDCALSQSPPDCVGNLQLSKQGVGDAFSKPRCRWGCVTVEEIARKKEGKKETGIAVGHSPRSLESMVTALCSSRPPAGAAPPNRARKSGRAVSPAGLRVATMRFRLVMAMLSPSNSRASNLGKWDRNSRMVAVFIVMQDCVTMPPVSRKARESYFILGLHHNLTLGDSGSVTRPLPKPRTPA